MTSRKTMWDSLDKLEGRPVGSSHAHLEKERARQGYKSSALRKKSIKERIALNYPKGFPHR